MAAFNAALQHSSHLVTENDRRSFLANNSDDGDDDDADSSVSWKRTRRSSEEDDEETTVSFPSSDSDPGVSLGSEDTAPRGFGTAPSPNQPEKSFSLSLSEELAVPSLPAPPSAPRRSQRQPNSFMPEANENEMLSRERERDENDRLNASTCPICWEEQPYLEGASSAASSAMLDRINDFRNIIFRYEKLMRGRQNDETIFRGMLELRRTYIERYLDMYSSGQNRYRRWTMQILRDHYNPEKGHRFDPVRELDIELQDLRKIKRWMMSHAMFVPNPDGDDPLFNVRAVDIRVRVARQYTETLKRKSELLSKRAPAAIVDSQLVMRAVNDSVNRKKVVEATDAGAAALYEVGGL